MSDKNELLCKKYIFILLILFACLYRDENREI